MTATDELRKLLDERGVKHEDKHTELVPGISDWDSTWWRGIAGLEFHAVGDETFGRDGCVYINGTYLTPEQAIAATLGNEACEWQGSVGQGWCQGAYDATIDEYDGFFTTWHILGCGHGVLMADDEKPSYCPECGAKVVER